MTKRRDPTSVPLAPVLVARMLSSALGEPEASWSMRLANGRRPERHSPIPWQETEAGHPIYLSGDVEAFIGQTLTQRASSTAPTAEGEIMTKATAVADAESERPFVRVFWNTGTAQGAFGLSIRSAKSLSQKLAEAAKLAESRMETA
jgi:hypothetical protein